MALDARSERKFNTIILKEAKRLIENLELSNNTKNADLD